MKEALRKRFLGAANLRRPIKLVWESARLWTIASLALMVVQALLPIAALYLIKLTVDAVTAGIISPDKTAALKEVLLLIAVTGLVTLLVAACKSAADIVKEHQGQLVTDYVTDLIHRQSAAIDLAYYEDPCFHDTFYRAQAEAPYRPNKIVNELTQLVQNVISLIALGGLLFYLHWSVAVILFVAVLPLIIVKISQADRLYAWQKRRTETERRAFDYHRMLTDIFYAKELRLFDLGDIFRKRHREMRETLREEKLSLAKVRTWMDLAAQVAAVFALFGMLAFIAWKTLQKMMTIGDMVMYYQAFQRAQTALQGIMGGLAGLYEDNLFLNHFYGFIDLKSNIAINGGTADPPRPMEKGITFENVRFSYPGSPKEAIRGLDLAIAPGEIVALVGDNGAGKSTLAKLLCRLYDPQSGQICIDGTDYRSFDVIKLRREITMIFQDYIRYPLTARENIWVGDVTVDHFDEKIEEAARQSGADEMIRSLSDGYDTVLGKHLEKGQEISIGEWQKIALARAFLRDAQLIILDEPTSSMSVRAENELFLSFKKLLNGRSALLISHRFSTVCMADLICVMEEGQIIERGSHEELMRTGGHYSHLYELQAQYYR